MKKTILTILAGAGCALASCAQPAPSGNYSLSVTFPAEAEADDYMAYIVDVDTAPRSTALSLPTTRPCSAARSTSPCSPE